MSTIFTKRLAGPRAVALFNPPPPLSGVGAGIAAGVGTGAGGSLGMPDWMAEAGADAGAAFIKSRVGAGLCKGLKLLNIIDDCKKMLPSYWFKVVFYWVTWPLWKSWEAFSATWDDPAEFRKFMTGDVAKLTIATIAIAFIIHRAISKGSLLGVSTTSSKILDMG